MQRSKTYGVHRFAAAAGFDESLDLVLGNLPQRCENVLVFDPLMVAFVPGLAMLQNLAGRLGDRIQLDRVRWGLGMHARFPLAI